MNIVGFPRRVRTLWISDIHLGTRGCRADDLLAFLRTIECRTFYLVGDIVDCWRLKKSWYWPASHQAVVREFLRRANAGVEVIFIPGNHDEAAREFDGLDMAGIKIRTEAIHVAADDRRFLVVHGDGFDGVVRYARWLYCLGDRSYRVMLRCNRVFNQVRRLCGLPYWSLSAFLKHRVKNAVQFIADFEIVLAQEARRRGVDGVVCGHIHHAEIRFIGDVLYCNDGDWTESCTALVEHFDGRLEILQGGARNRLESQGTRLAQAS